MPERNYCNNFCRFLLLLIIFSCIFAFNNCALGQGTEICKVSSFFIEFFGFGVLVMIVPICCLLVNDVYEKERKAPAGPVSRPSSAPLNEGAS